MLLTGFERVNRDGRFNCLPVCGVQTALSQPRYQITSQHVKLLVDVNTDADRESNTMKYKYFLFETSN